MARNCTNNRYCCPGVFFDGSHGCRVCVYPGRGEGRVTVNVIISQPDGNMPSLTELIQALQVVQTMVDRNGWPLEIIALNIEIKLDQDYQMTDRTQTGESTDIAAQ